MPVYRVTFVFDGPGGQGWNEVHSRDVSNATSAVAVTADLLNARISMLDKIYRLRAIRSTSNSGDRVTGNRVVNLQGLAGIETDPNPAGLAMVLSLTGVNGGSRKLWQRGLSEGWVTIDKQSGRDTPDAFVLQGLKTYFTALAANGFGIVTQKKPAPGPLDYKGIVKVDGSAMNGKTVLTTDAPNLFVQGMYVNISQMDKKQYPGLNGTFKVLASTANTFTIQYVTAQSVATTATVGRVRQRDFNPISVYNPDLCAFDHYGTRATKNPTTHSRGSRRAVKIRNLA